MTPNVDISVAPKPIPQNGRSPGQGIESPHELLTSSNRNKVVHKRLKDLIYSPYQLFSSQPGANLNSRIDESGANAFLAPQPSLEVQGMVGMTAMTGMPGLRPSLDGKLPRQSSSRKVINTGDVILSMPNFHNNQRFSLDSKIQEDQNFDILYSTKPAPELPVVQQQTNQQARSPPTD